MAAVELMLEGDNYVGLGVQVDDETVWLRFRTATGMVVALNVAVLAEESGGPQTKCYHAHFYVGSGEAEMIDTPLKDLLDEAMKRYNAMTPEEQQEMWRAQKRSWVRGELMLSYPEMTYEEADQRARDAEQFCIAAPKCPQ